MYTPPTSAETELDRQNFATSRRSRCSEPQEGTDGARESLDTAWLRWWSLFREPDAWTDPEKRRAMLRARMEYQYAVLTALHN